MGVVYRARQLRPERIVALKVIAPELAADPDYRERFLRESGIAKQLAAAGTTQTGVFVGTIDYAAPEQFEGKPVDARTDVYAAGCVLYQMLTGQVPFPADAEAGKVYAHLTTDPPSIRAVDPR